jgi:branched-chain amino acid transport system permease protein
MKNWRYIIYAVLAVLAIAFPFYTGSYPQVVATKILVFLALALSWDMLLRSGQLSFGIAGFFGLGGYAAALICLNLGLNPLLGIILGGLAAGAIALVLGFAVLRLRGMYFAITTLALAEVFRVIVRNWPSLTGGPEGKMLPSTIFAGDSTQIYWLMLGIVIITIVVSEVFEKSRIHLALTSIRNNEIVAKSSGIDIFKYLVFAFAITSAIQGIVGGAYAQIYGFVSPEGSFHLDFTLLPLAMALLGGIYSTPGPIVGAVILGVVAEYLKLQIPYGHLLVYGVIIVVVILFMPKGIVGTVRERIQRRQAIP